MIINVGLRGKETPPGHVVEVMFNKFHNYNQNGLWGGWGAMGRDCGSDRPLSLGALPSGRRVVQSS